VSVRSSIKTDALPVHIGIIMDGNGRWAVKQGKARTAGHYEGLTATKRAVLATSELGIKYLTVYAFSTENWRRTADEVKYLMRLVAVHLRKEWDFYYQNHVRVTSSGYIEGLPAYVQKELRFIEEKTAHFDGTTVNIAINYGGRDEIIRAVNKLNANRQNGNAIDEQALSGYIDRPDLPDPDLIIRTGGQKRLSNFLLWQCAYSELYFCDTLWPDFDAEDLYKAVYDFQQRKRNFGGNK
jgi:undecaprenyl diphosphate synthase